MCAALHWLIGVAQRSIVRRFVPSLQDSDNAPASLKNLIFEWIANALRTLVWMLYFVLLIYLMPQTRTQIESVGSMLARLRGGIIEWLQDRGIKVVIVIVVIIFLMRFASALIKTIFTLFERSAVARDEIAARRRLETLSVIFRGAVQTIISFVGLMILLQQLHVDITPILASAGVVGIAVGFGAQSLIKDLFSGLLILLEEQYSVGDTVKIGDIAGTVEQLTLRVTRIRGLDGSLTTIPNGTITTVSNMSKDWSRVVLDVEVNYAEDIDRAMNIMLEAARQMREEHPQDIIEEPSMLGVDKLSYTGATLRLMVKTTPTKHFEIGRELRRRIKLAFEREGIKAPLPPLT